MTFGSFRLNTLSAALAASGTITATGGVISYYTSGGTNYKLHAFTTTGSNSFIVSAVTGTATVDALIVGAGGRGGQSAASYGAGGGGAGGGVVSQSNISVTAQTYSLTIGAGGGGGFGVGGSSSGFGYTALGGGVGTLNSAATNGGGSGTSTSTGYTSTIGTAAYKGGNSSSGTTAQNAGAGGGAGAGGAGVNGSSGVGGNAGIGFASTITGSTYYYGNGGGGGGATQGQGYTTAGALSTAVADGAATSTNAGSGALNYGAGSGGVYAPTLITSNNGGQGVAYVRYPITGDYVWYVSNTTGTTNSITLPTMLDGDIGILVNYASNTSSTIPTAVTPSGWTNAVNTSNSSTRSIRNMIHYKVMTAAQSGTAVTLMATSTVNASCFILYRPSRTFTISTSTATSQSGYGTTAVISNQTLTMTSQATPYIGIVDYATTATSGFTTGSTTTATRDISFGTTSIVRLFESTDSTVAYATSTLSCSTSAAHAQSLAAFRLILT